MKDIYLDDVMKHILFPLAGVDDWFRHTTDKIGSIFLIRNKDPNVAISAEKFTIYNQGIETEGNILLHVTGKYINWSPEDAYTYIDIDGKRWQDIEAMNYIPHSIKNDYNNKIIEIARKYKLVEKVVNAMRQEIRDATSFKNLLNKFDMADIRQTYEFFVSDRLDPGKYIKGLRDKNIVSPSLDYDGYEKALQVPDIINYDFIWDKYKEKDYLRIITTGRKASQIKIHLLETYFPKTTDEVANEIIELQRELASIHNNPESYGIDRKVLAKDGFK